MPGKDMEAVSAQYSKINKLYLQYESVKSLDKI